MAVSCHFLGETNMAKQEKNEEIRMQEKKQVFFLSYELRIMKEEEEKRKIETCKKQRERKTLEKKYFRYCYFSPH